jgi:hypothetical protein
MGGWPILPLVAKSDDRRGYDNFKQTYNRQLDSCGLLLDTAWSSHKKPTDLAFPRVSVRYVKMQGCQQRPEPTLL